MASAPRSPSSTGAGHRDGEYGVLDELRTTTIFSSLSKLFLSDKFADMTIRCPGQDFQAHRAVVCTQSPFFDKALSGGFMESSTGIIHLPEADPNVVRRFLQFLYTGNYDDGALPTSMPSDPAMMTPSEVEAALAANPGEIAVEEEDEEEGGDDEFFGTDESRYEQSEGEPQEEYDDFDGEDDRTENSTSRDEPEPEGRDGQAMFLSLRVYLMADQYDVPALRLLARDKFYREAEALCFVCDEFPDVVEEVYANTRENDVALREIVARLVANGLGESGLKQKMEPVMRKYGDFAVDVINYRMTISEPWR